MPHTPEIRFRLGNGKRIILSEYSESEIANFILKKGVKSSKDLAILLQNYSAESKPVQVIRLLQSINKLKKGFPEKYHITLDNITFENGENAILPLLKEYNLIFKIVKPENLADFYKQISDYTYRPKLRKDRNNTNDHKLDLNTQTISPYVYSQDSKIGRNYKRTKKQSATLLSPELHTHYFQQQYITQAVGFIFNRKKCNIRAKIKYDRGTFNRGWVGNKEEVESFKSAMNGVLFTSDEQFHKLINEEPLLNEILVEFTRESIEGILIATSGKEIIVGVYAGALLRQQYLSEKLKINVPIVVYNNQEKTIKALSNQELKLKLFKHAYTKLNGFGQRLIYENETKEAISELLNIISNNFSEDNFIKQLNIIFDTAISSNDLNANLICTLQTLALSMKISTENINSILPNILSKLKILPNKDLINILWNISSPSYFYNILNNPIALSSEVLESLLTLIQRVDRQAQIRLLEYSYSTCRCLGCIKHDHQSFLERVKETRPNEFPFVFSIMVKNYNIKESISLIFDPSLREEFKSKRIQLLKELFSKFNTNTSKIDTLLEGTNFTKNEVIMMMQEDPPDILPAYLIFLKNRHISHHNGVHLLDKQLESHLNNMLHYLNELASLSPDYQATINLLKKDISAYHASEKTIQAMRTLTLSFKQHMGSISINISKNDQRLGVALDVFLTILIIPIIIKAIISLTKPIGFFGKTKKNVLYEKLEDMSSKITPKRNQSPG